jgi:tyrosine-protein kinase Etk/Wzc
MTPSARTSSLEDTEINLLDLIITLGEEKKTVFASSVIAAMLAIAVSALMTPIYTAKAVIMLPQQQQQGAAALALASLGAVAGLAAGAATGIKSSDEMYISLMQSESLQNEVIKKMTLQNRYGFNTLMDTRAALKNAIKISSDKKSGLINIEADDKDPEFAAKLANIHIDELRNLLGRLAVTDAQQRRVFYEQAIAKTQSELAEAEAIFRVAKEKSGMQVTLVIADAAVKAGAEMRTQIAAKEVQLAAMGKFATPQNPDMQRAASELSALRTQLAKLEHGSGADERFSPVEQLAIKSYRDIKARESMVALLTTQYESARVDEANEGPLIQVIDVARTPERKSKPRRSIIVLSSALGGLFLGITIIFMPRAIRKVARTEVSLEQMTRLKRAWRIRA